MVDTIVVVGAAVSAELGFPLGGDLKEKITARLPQERAMDVSEPVTRALGASMDNDWDRVFRAATRVRMALEIAGSIDEVLRRHADPDMIAAGKIGIAANILEAEAAAADRWGVSAGALADLRPLANSTFAQVIEVALHGATPATLAASLGRFAFVVFNYDRCLELLLYRILIRSWFCTPVQAAELVGALNIWHPYGQIGVLAMEGGTVQDAVPFGELIRRVDLHAIAGSLRTFSEKGEDADRRAYLDWVRGCRQMIFLGCFPHAQNLEILAPEARVGFATGYGTTYAPPAAAANGQRPDMASYTEPLARLWENTLRSWPRDNKMGFQGKFEPLDCSQFVSKYRREWSPPAA